MCVLVRAAPRSVTAWCMRASGRGRPGRAAGWRCSGPVLAIRVADRTPAAGPIRCCARPLGCRRITVRSWGAKRGASTGRRKATCSAVRRLSSQVNAISGHARHRQATARLCLLSSRSRADAGVPALVQGLQARHPDRPAPRASRPASRQRPGTPHRSHTRHDHQNRHRLICSSGTFRKGTH